ncbi:nicotinate-nucleotide adenylyltransferase [Methylocella sp.]|uniref:nicotinate-nucleotide adenylyltransferase n=1 Tax=Methylocella sp. TaxID=1978226 RepID=UPI0037840A14
MTRPPSRALPPHGPGLRVGLFGGSFNPPHEGHAAVVRLALRRLALDAAWLLVSPGNPLKDARELAPLALRLAQARGLTRDPRVRATAIEAATGSRYSVDVARYLMRRCPGTRFVWIMGADSLASFHRWRRWREIARLMPIAVVDRPGSTLTFGGAPAGAFLARFRIDESRAARLAGMTPPAFVFLHGRRSQASSTALRAARKKSFDPAPELAS